VGGCEFEVLVGAEDGCGAVAGGDGVGWGHGLVVGGLGEAVLLGGTWVGGLLM
jgi:hypothetical protein